MAQELHHPKTPKDPHKDSKPQRRTARPPRDAVQKPLSESEAAEFLRDHPAPEEFWK